MFLPCKFARGPRRRAPLPIAAFAAALVAGPAAAQSPKAAALDPVFVTATRTPQPIDRLLADVSVIERAEILRSGVQSLPELLQRQPGIEIVQNGGPASTSGVFLRGTNRGQTLVLVDGLRIASSTVGATSLEAIPLADVERIEILRGPASSLYGSDAIGGVIQVFTRRATQPFSANAQAGYGSHDTRQASAGLGGSLGGSLGALRLSVQGGGERSDGFNAITDARNFSYNPDRDGYRREHVAANAALDWAQGQTLSAQVFESRQNAQFDAGPGFDDRTITTLTSWQVGSRNRIGERWTSRLTAGEGRDDSLSRTGFGDSRFTTVQRQYGWQNELAIGDGQLTLAVERREERVAGADFPVTSRDTNAVLAVYQVEAGPHAIQANVRRDDSSQYGGRTTGGIAYGLRLSPSWRLTASAGTAFKAPSFNDLYFPDFSNPDLEPETARSAEAALHWSARVGELALGARAVAWYNRVREMIVFGCNADFVCRPDNVARATLKGVTLGGDVAWRETVLGASLDLQSPEDDDTGLLLPRRARSHGALTVSQRLGPVTLGAELVASSRRFDDAANAVPLGGYAIVNLTAEWSIGRGVTLVARGDNVLDRDYELAAGYANGGARGFVGVRWNL